MVKAIAKPASRQCEGDQRQGDGCQQVAGESYRIGYLENVADVILGKHLDVVDAQQEDETRGDQPDREPPARPAGL
jgi:hypothetical protein